MANDSKLGLLAGIAVVLVVAVFFQSKPSAGTAFIQNDNGQASSATSSSSTSPVSNNSSSLPEHTSAPAQAPAGVTVLDNGTRTIWQPTEPREAKPVSRDPLLWP